MTITGTSPGEDFYALHFDFQLGPGVTPSEIGWIGETPSYDPPGPQTSVPIYSFNSDMGVSTTDLKTILISANPANSYRGVHVRHPGENEASSPPFPPLPPPTYLGSAFAVLGRYSWGGPQELGRYFAPCQY